MLSPVEASTRYLAYLRDAGSAPKDLRSPNSRSCSRCPPVSMKKPVSSRSKRPAMPRISRNLTLLEEPAAAFYAWISGSSRALE